MIRYAAWLSLMVYVSAFMPIVQNHHLCTQIRSMPQNSSLHSDLVPISKKMSTTQLQVMLALVEESPPLPKGNFSIDYSLRFLIELSKIAFPDPL